MPIPYAQIINLETVSLAGAALGWYQLGVLWGVPPFAVSYLALRQAFVQNALKDFKDWSVKRLRKTGLFFKIMAPPAIKPSQLFPLLSSDRSEDDFQKFINDYEDATEANWLAVLSGINETILSQTFNDYTLKRYFDAHPKMFLQQSPPSERNEQPPQQPLAPTPFTSALAKLAQRSPLFRKSWTRLCTDSSRFSEWWMKAEATWILETLDPTLLTMALENYYQGPGKGKIVSEISRLTAMPSVETAKWVACLEAMGTSALLTLAARVKAGSEIENSDEVAVAVYPSTSGVLRDERFLPLMKALFNKMSPAYLKSWVGDAQQESISTSTVLSLSDWLIYAPTAVCKQLLARIGRAHVAIRTVLKDPNFIEEFKDRATHSEQMIHRWLMLHVDGDANEATQAQQRKAAVARLVDLIGSPVLRLVDALRPGDSGGREEILAVLNRRPGEEAAPVQAELSDEEEEAAPAPAPAPAPARAPQRRRRGSGRRRRK